MMLQSSSACQPNSIQFLTVTSVAREKVVLSGGKIC